MIGLRRILKVTNILFVIFISSLSQATEICSLEWAKEGLVVGANTIVSVGVSSNKDMITAKEEAKNSAYSDVTKQLSSSVMSSMTLSETEKETTFKGTSVVQSQMSQLIGIKIIKEGANANLGYSSCIGVRLDVRDAYKVPEGKMKALEAKTNLVAEAAKAKDYLKVLKFGDQAVLDIQKNKNEIVAADVFKVFLKQPGSTWFQKFEELAAEIKNMQIAARSSIVFVIPDGEYESVFLDIEAALADKGFDVSRNKSEVSAEKIQLIFEVKQVGGLRKSKTALGNTYIAKIMVSLKDGKSKKVVSTNRGADIIGTGNNEEDALANIDRQLTSHLVKVIEDAVPGINLNI